MLHYQQYFEFLRYAIDPNKQYAFDTKDLDWCGLYRFAKEQAIVGVLFEGVKRLREQGIKPPFELLMQWIALAEQIEGQNKLLNRRCVEVIEEYHNAGFECCVLKGQGNATMYPNPLSRTPGDIDLWVIPADGRCKTYDVRRDVTQYVKENHPENMEVRYYHVGYQDKRTEVEAHFMPNIMNNPLFHRRLQKWYRKMADGGCLKGDVELPDGVGSIPVPIVEFNIIFQLAHMMHHFFDEGIGLRQFVDYYFVLRAKHNQQVVHDSRFMVHDSHRTIKETLKYLGLWKFAGAVMYVMREVFALDEAYMIAPVDEKRGKTLMAEILKGGNFGRHSGLTNHSTGGKYFAKTWRNLKLVREYPAEALCEPFFRTWHFFWRMRYN